MKTWDKMYKSTVVIFFSLIWRVTETSECLSRIVPNWVFFLEQLLGKQKTWVTGLPPQQCSTLYNLPFCPWLPAESQSCGHARLELKWHRLGIRGFHYACSWWEVSFLQQLASLLLCARDLRLRNWPSWSHKAREQAQSSLPSWTLAVFPKEGPGLGWGCW